MVGSVRLKAVAPNGLRDVYVLPSSRRRKLSGNYSARTYVQQAGKRSTVWGQVTQNSDGVLLFQPTPGSKNASLV